VTQASTATLNTTVPWFMQNMPSSYFKQTSRQTRVEHIKAVAALRDTDMDLSLTMKSSLPDGRRVMTFIRPENKAGLLLSLLPQLPRYEDRNLSRVQLYTMSDGGMCLNMFTYGEGEDVKEEKRKELVEKVGQDATRTRAAQATPLLTPLRLARSSCPPPPSRAWTRTRCAPTRTSAPPAT
jgi:hypothetical protein